jgi:tRNA pseudouridine55 synthase
LNNELITNDFMGDNMNPVDFQAGTVMLFDKPLDWTSFDLVNRVRNMLCRKLSLKKLKVGHAGTLDPKATGLVIICTGKATKQIDLIQAQEKEYVATLKLGATTPSFDLESEEDAHFPVDHITTELIEHIIPQFLGEIDQVPPIFSAIKVNGKRAFDYARKGTEIELKSRKIVVKSITIERFEMPELELRIACSKGTYVRSLARDMGIALSSGAYLVGLRRTAIGESFVDKALTLDEFQEKLASA